jgi:hypothetical protein
MEFGARLWSPGDVPYGMFREAVQFAATRSNRPTSYSGARKWEECSGEQDV